MSNLRATGQGCGDELLARALYRFEQARWPAPQGESEHEQRSPSGRPDPADAALAVPLIIGRALKLPPEDVAFLISADLFACGIATLVQCLGFPGVGIRLPVIMGVTFASVGPMLSMAAAPDVGLLGIYGSVVSAGA